MISRNIFWVREIFSFFHTVCITVWKNEKFSHWKKFRQINYLVISLVTVWKSTRKRYHDEKNSVKTHKKIMRNLILQKDDFLPFRSISGYFTLNKFWRLPSFLTLILKSFFELVNMIGANSYQKLVNFERDLLSWSAMVRRAFNAYY